jgi:hypothetical protein
MKGNIMILLNRLILLLIAFTMFFSSQSIAAEKKSKKSKQKTSQESIQRQLPDDPTPFGFVMGKTTIEEAKSIWDDEEAEIEGTLFGFANKSEIDNDPDGVLNENVQIFIIKDLPMDGLESSRFAFMNGTLFLIKYEMSGDKEQLVLQITSKYGEPQTDPFEFETYLWEFKNVSLVLKENTLLFLHNNIASEAEASNSKIYSEYIRQKAKEERGI